MQAQRQLDPEDPRYARLQYLTGQADQRNLTAEERNFVVAAIQGASEEGRRAQMRVRSFRNVILFTAALIAVLAVVVAVTGFFRPDLLPLCFQPDGLVVCPTEQTSLEPAQSSALPAGGQPAEPSLGDIDDTIDRTAGRSDATLVELVGCSERPSLPPPPCAAAAALWTRTAFPSPSPSSRSSRGR